MNLNELKGYYVQNPIILIFVLANITANLACALMFATWDSTPGVLFGLCGIAISIALAFSLPIMARSANGRRGLLLMVGLFTACDVGMSLIAAEGRFAYAKLSAEKNTALSQTYSNVATQSSATIKKCFDAGKNCSSADRIGESMAAAEKLKETPVVWTPHSLPHGNIIVHALAIAIAFISSLGGTVMGYITGIGESSEKKRSALGLAA